MIQKIVQRHESNKDILLNRWDSVTLYLSS